MPNELRELYESEYSKLRQNFSATKDGLSFLRQHSSLVESLTLQVWEQIIPRETQLDGGLTLLACGDFGRQALFPYSEIDLLILFPSQEIAEKWRRPLERFSQEMRKPAWKMSELSKTLDGCRQLLPGDAESLLALLDCRYLGGDRKLHAQLKEKVIPELVARDTQVLLQHLAEVTRSRHHKFGHTVFHVEPNVKDGPGGYRDYTLACWLATLSVLEKQQPWPETEALFSPQVKATLESAWRFLSAVRCFLHFRSGRDDNILSWDAQDEAAAQKLGAPAAEGKGPLQWMRLYFGHASAIDRISNRLLEESPAAHSLFYRELETWRTGFSDSDFLVVDGVIYLHRPGEAANSALLFRLFLLMAQRGFKLSPAAEHQLEEALPSLAQRLPAGHAIWRFLAELLPQPHAVDALRAMHALHLLTLILPELREIDALAVRDFAQRFTVDEHTLRAMENLHALRQSKSKWDERYAEILNELEQPELLYLAILLHDVGKAVTLAEPIPESLAVAQACLDRLGLSPADRETALFLIAHHLDMGATLRRDIYDPHTITQFADRAGTPDRLKMLCLFTYADLRAVNPEALTPWKAEDLWQLYIGTANHLDRTVDERVHADAHDEVLSHLRTLAAAAGEKFQTFLEGFPRRYLLTYPVDDILRHFEMAGRLQREPVQLALKRSRHWYELTLVTLDRPFLFATVAGALTACGMNIGKAGAYSNQSGTVVDTFYFSDRFRTLEMNLPAWERFKETVHAILSGKRNLKEMLRDALRQEKKEEPGKAKEPPQVLLDDHCSPHSTLVEVIAPDQPGLLYRIASLLAQQKCNIDIALIDTEGATAIDVFYLTSAGSKLAPEQQNVLRQALLTELAG